MVTWESCKVQIECPNLQKYFNSGIDLSGIWCPQIIVLTLVLLLHIDKLNNELSPGPGLVSPHWSILWFEVVWTVARERGCEWAAARQIKRFILWVHGTFEETCVENGRRRVCAGGPPRTEHSSDGCLSLSEDLQKHKHIWAMNCDEEE